MEEIQKRIDSLEKRLKELEQVQKQDADETVGLASDLLWRTEMLEEEVEQLKQEVQGQSNLLLLDSPP